MKIPKKKTGKRKGGAAMQCYTAVSFYRAFDHEIAH
jgi:hypothetical protein